MFNAHNLEPLRLANSNMVTKFQFMLRAVLLLAGAFYLSGCATAYLKDYQGNPFQDSRYHGGAQKIPGRVQCAYYDVGGEGVAYHTADTVNHGSGALNPADGTYLNEFRMKEGVDISYTKTHNIDDNPYNKVPRTMDKLYVG